MKQRKGPIRTDSNLARWRFFFLGVLFLRFFAPCDDGQRTFTRKVLSKREHTWASYLACNIRAAVASHAMSRGVCGEQPDIESEDEP